MRIEVTTETDRDYCETCGSSYAEGGTVKFGESLPIEFKPIAHCYASQSWSLEELLSYIIVRLDHTLVIDGVEFFETDMDRQ